MTAFLTGLALGATVAAQIGPIWLLCARSVLRGRTATGLAIGAGAALIDMSYASLGVAGAARLLEIDALRVGLGLVGAGVLVALGARTLWSAHRVRLGGELPDELASPGRAFRTSLAATASNPSTIASWAAAFLATATADLVDSAGGAALLVAGIGVGSLAWFTALSGALSLARRRIDDRGLRVVDTVAGAGLVGFGGVLGVRTLRQP